jgi:hypothetical protein
MGGGPRWAHHREEALGGRAEIGPAEERREMSPSPKRHRRRVIVQDRSSVILFRRQFASLVSFVERRR